MAEKKPHLHFRNPVEGTVQFKQRLRNVTQTNDGLPKYYDRMKDEFRTCISQFNADRAERIQNRSASITVPHIDYIKLTFFSSFDSEKFVPRYRQNFGLVPIKFDLFNTQAIFAIENETNFQSFFSDLQSFLNADEHTGELSYNVDVRFIKKFTLLTNREIKSYDNYYDVALFNLVDSEEIFTTHILPIEKGLLAYLTQQNIRHEIIFDNRTIQTWGISETEINNIISNFDIIHSVNSSLTGVIKPGAFNTPIRDFGFTLAPPQVNAETIGILDSGIANITALRDLIKNTNTEYDLKGSGSLIDNYDRGHGHGTGVAGLATFGSKLIPDHTGSKQADAWLISLKIFEENTPRSSDKAIIDLITQVNSDKGVRIFVLTVTEMTSKKKNESFSAFAYALDKLAHEKDILIFISSGNIGIDYFFDNSNAPIHSYPLDFHHDYTNIKSPSESMNNISVGACAGNFETGINSGISLDKDFPAIYSSKFHYDFEAAGLSKNQSNKHVKKPDVIYYGGDFDSSLVTSDPGIKTFSARSGIFYDKAPGTSYSAPLVANIAACILNNYPSLRTQSVKALIINSAKHPKLGNSFDGLSKKALFNLIGHGIPNYEECIKSNDNSVTVILEDEISPDTIKSFEIKIPEYLLEKQNKQTVLDITATLCFSFEPILNNQMTYCPIHIGFGIFKNLPLEEVTNLVDENGVEKAEMTGINGNTTDEISFKPTQTWSEDYYYKRKLLSNTQKVEWIYNKTDISDNGNVFKLAVNCKRHKLLSVVQKEKYNTPHKFSIVLNFKEKPLKKQFAGNLYNEMEAINDFNLITNLDNEGEAIAEA